MWIVILFCLPFLNVHAWDSEQLEVFDVVDEVKENFYELLDIPKVSQLIFINTVNS